MLLTVDQRDFINNCETVLSKYGTVATDNILGRECECLIYKDSAIELYKSIDSFEMEIVRVKETLPVVLKQKNEFILFHPHYVYLEDHVRNLSSKGK